MKYASPHISPQRLVSPFFQYAPFIGLMHANKGASPLPPPLLKRATALLHNYAPASQCLPQLGTFKLNPSAKLKAIQQKT